VVIPDNTKGVDLTDEQKQTYCKTNGGDLCRYEKKTNDCRSMAKEECEKARDSFKDSVDNYVQPFTKESPETGVPTNVAKWFESKVKDGTCNELVFEERRHGIANGTGPSTRLEAVFDFPERITINMVSCNDGQLSAEMIKALKDVLEKAKDLPNRAVTIRANQCVAVFQGAGLSLDLHITGSGCQVKLPQCKDQVGLACPPPIISTSVEAGWCVDELPFLGVRYTSCLKCDINPNLKFDNLKEPADYFVYQRTDRAECEAKTGMDVPFFLGDNQCFDIQRIKPAAPTFQCEQKCKCTFTSNGIKTNKPATTTGRVRAADRDAAEIAANKKFACTPLCKVSAPADATEATGVTAPGYPLCSPVVPK
jgi:hypothetical protein